MSKGEGGAVKMSPQLKWGGEAAGSTQSEPSWEPFPGLGIAGDAAIMPRAHHPHQTVLPSRQCPCLCGRKNAALQRRATWGLEVVAWQSYGSKELIHLQEAGKAGEAWRRGQHKPW